MKIKDLLTIIKEHKIKPNDNIEFTLSDETFQQSGIESNGYTYDIDYTDYGVERVDGGKVTLVLIFDLNEVGDDE